MVGDNIYKKQYLLPEISETSLRKDKLHEKIRRVAYDLYEKRGRTCGNELADWFQAEKSCKDGFVG